MKKFNKKIETNAHFYGINILLSRYNNINHRSGANALIIQYLIKLNFASYFTKPVIRHILEFIIAATQKGYSGTVTDIVNLSLANCHRTTFGKFLSQGVWKSIHGKL
jgi:hypothetical protein